MKSKLLNILCLLFLFISFWELPSLQAKGGPKIDIKRKKIINKTKKVKKKFKDIKTLNTEIIYGSYHSKALSYKFENYDKFYIENQYSWLDKDNVSYENNILIIKPLKNSTQNTRNAALILENTSTNDKKRIEFVQPPNNDLYKAKIEVVFKTTKWFNINKKIDFNIMPKHDFELLDLENSWRLKTNANGKSYINVPYWFEWIIESAQYQIDNNKISLTDEDVYIEFHTQKFDGVENKDIWSDNTKIWIWSDKSISRFLINNNDWITVSTWNEYGYILEIKKNNTNTIRKWVITLIDTTNWIEKDIWINQANPWTIVLKGTVTDNEKKYNLSWVKVELTPSSIWDSFAITDTKGQYAIYVREWWEWNLLIMASYLTSNWFAQFYQVNNKSYWKEFNFKISKIDIPTNNIINLSESWWISNTIFDLEISEWMVVKEDSEWIQNVSVLNGKLLFKYDANKLSEAREAEIMIIYPSKWKQFKYTIKQVAGNTFASSNVLVWEDVYKVDEKWWTRRMFFVSNQWTKAISWTARTEDNWISIDELENTDLLQPIPEKCSKSWKIHIKYDELPDDIKTRTWTVIVELDWYTWNKEVKVVQTRSLPWLRVSDRDVMLSGHEWEYEVDV